MTEDPSVTRAVGRLGWTMFIVLTIGYFFVYFHRMAVGVVGDDIIDDVGGSKGILNSVYFWTYTLMQIPCGLMADRFGPRLTSSVFLAVASVGSLLTFSADSFAAVAVGKAMIAVGMAVVYIPLMKIVSMWFPRRDFAVLNGIVIAVGNVGAIAAGGPLRMLADAVGWRDVFLVLGTVTFILAVACAVLIRDHPKDVGLPSVEESEEAETGRPREESSAAKVPMLAGLKLVASGGRRFWPCALAYFMVYGSIMVFQATWAATYFDTVYDFALSASWMITALGIGKIASTVAVGSLVSHGIIKYKRRTMILGGTAFALVWVVLFLFAGGDRQLLVLDGRQHALRVLRRVHDPLVQPGEGVVPPGGLRDRRGRHQHLPVPWCQRLHDRLGVHHREAVHPQPVLADVGADGDRFRSGRRPADRIS